MPASSSSTCSIINGSAIEIKILAEGGVVVKKIINNAADVEREMLEGLVAASPKKLVKLNNYNIVLRANLNPHKVALVSGGGSGHEPAHAGYVGFGMLDAAVAGSVFTSPTAGAILKTIETVANRNGVLCIVKNYTGDVLNFEIAIEKARSDGINVDYVIVADDVASQSTAVGRRGVAGTVLVHKIAGALAETGANLAQVKMIAQRTIDNVRSMGMAITPCTVPATGVPSFELSDKEMEIGIGIHGERGMRREQLTNADGITRKMLDRILSHLEYAGHEVVVMVNGMGGTPFMELCIVNNFIKDYLYRNGGIEVYDTMIGNYMTSIEMAGFSLTLLRLDDELKMYYDAAADTFALKK